MSRRGFSFVEMSIVLSITGLVLAAIIAGSHMLTAAKLNSVITDMAQIKTAVDGFETKYGALPGDMPDAASFWSQNCTNTGGTPNNTCNGDGNRRIEYSSTQFEDLRAWQHLSLSSYFPGDFTGLVSGNRFSLGTNAPESEITGVGYWLMYPSSALYNTTGIAIMAGKVNSATGYPNAAAFSIEHAHALDIKVDDDGDPDGGDLYEGRGSDMGNNKCMVGASPLGDFTDTNAVSFNFGDSNDLDESCVLVYWLDKDDAD